MAFNPSTAAPVGQSARVDRAPKKAGFNPATAKPAETFEQMQDYNAAPVSDIPGSPDAVEQPTITNVPSPPFGVSYNLFRGAKTGEDIAKNANRMGFEVVSAPDGGVLMKRGEEVYRYDPDSMWSQFVSAIRPTAQALGSIGGAVVSAPAAALTGPAAPAVLAAGGAGGGVLGGQTTDALAELAEPSNRTPMDVLKLAGADAVEQVAGAAAGGIVGPLASGAAKAGGRAIATAGRGVESLKGRIEPTITEAAPTEKSYQQLVDTIKAGKTTKAAGAVRPDLNLKQIADAEGIYLNPSHYSKNPVYIETEQAMKSKPGSLLNSREQAAIVRMGEVADDIKTSIGGQIDKSQLNSDYTQKVYGAIEKMRDQERQLYDKVSASAPKDTKVNPKNTLDYLKDRIQELGDAKFLTTEEAKVFNRLKSGKVNLALLDETRKQIGEGYNKQGPFRDASSRTLDGLYGAMTQDQEGVARVFGVDDIYQLAKKTTTDRKSIEEGLSGIYKNSNINPGLDLPLAAKLDSAVNQLTKGNVNDFRKTMALVPADMRTQAAATSLDTLFTNGARNKNNSIGQGFIAGYESLQKNKAARDELFKYLPKESQERLDNLYRVAKGVYSAKKWENTSGTARAMLANMDKDASALSKLYDFGRKAGAAEAAGNAVGMPGAGTVMTVATTLASNAKAPASKAADALIASPAFEEAVIEYAKGERREAGARLMRSKMYQNWLAEQPESVRSTVGATGLFSWLFGSQATDTPPTTEAP